MEILYKNHNRLYVRFFLAWIITKDEAALHTRDNKKQTLSGVTVHSPDKDNSEKEQQETVKNNVSTEWYICICIKILLTFILIVVGHSWIIADHQTMAMLLFKFISLAHSGTIMTEDTCMRIPFKIDMYFNLSQCLYGCGKLLIPLLTKTFFE